MIYNLKVIAKYNHMDICEILNKILKCSEDIKCDPDRLTEIIYLHVIKGYNFEYSLNICCYYINNGYTREQIIGYI